MPASWFSQICWAVTLARVPADLTPLLLMAICLDGDTLDLISLLWGNQSMLISQFFSHKEFLFLVPFYSETTPAHISLLWIVDPFGWIISVQVIRLNCVHLLFSSFCRSVSVPFLNVTRCQLVKEYTQPSVLACMERHGGHMSCWKQSTLRWKL